VLLSYPYFLRLRAVLGKMALTHPATVAKVAQAEAAEVLGLFGIMT
jgi:hypothetical protein